MDVRGLAMATLLHCLHTSEQQFLYTVSSCLLVPVAKFIKSE